MYNIEVVFGAGLISKLSGFWWGSLKFKKRIITIFFIQKPTFQRFIPSFSRVLKGQWGKSRWEYLIEEGGKTTPKRRFFNKTDRYNYLYFLNFRLLIKIHSVKICFWLKQETIPRLCSKIVYDSNAQDFILNNPYMVNIK